MKRTLLLTAALLGAGALVPQAAPVQVDAAIPAYQKVEGVSGSLNSIGSDTLNNLMTLWAESFRKAYPNVNAQIEGKGSATAPPALIEGTAQLGPMSRPMKDEETAAFEAKYQRDWNDPAGDEMKAVWSDAWAAANAGMPS